MVGWLLGETSEIRKDMFKTGAREGITVLRGADDNACRNRGCVELQTSFICGQ